MSTCTQRVAVVLLEKQVPFKFVLVDIGKGEQFFPATLEKQPFAKVPFIVVSICYIQRHIYSPECSSQSLFKNNTFRRMTGSPCMRVVP